jgi:copper/silver efflux system protein
VLFRSLMTVSVVMAALVPILWSTGVGSDIMKPIAAPIIGGMVTSTIHVLIITPVIFYIMKVRALHRGTLRPSACGPAAEFWTSRAAVEPNSR